MPALVSIIIPAYNRAWSLQRAVESLQRQTWQELEIIVVDDGSTDDTPRLAASLAAQDGRIKCLSHPKNRGAQAARNTGIYAARGDWISFLDSDDEYLPDSVAHRWAVAEEQRVPVVHSACTIVRDDAAPETYGVALAGDVYRDLLRAPGPVFPGFLIARHCFDKIGNLDEQQPSWQEWDTAIQLAKWFRFAYLAEPTFLYRYRGADSISRNMRRDAEGYERIVRKYRLAIVRHTGVETMSKHYLFAAKRFAMAGEKTEADRCQRLAKRWKLLSPRNVGGVVRRRLSKSKV